MKKKCILLYILIGFSLLSCEKDDDKFTTDSPFYALKDNRQWISTSSWANYSLTNEKMVIAGSKRDSEYYQDEQLHLSFKTTDISESNTVTDFYARWDFVIGGDAIGDSYIIDSNYNNLITINSFDTDKKKISGTFELRLVRDENRSDAGEKMYYKNGFFSLDYNESE
ncbi:DUF6252 family protein [uncultured Sunxiuqinia sp.]|uniref:DUF6252 family protein n=1 Tax=uncultured Sunxiuqinia sp. TaxID=1573825 RepID=UPI00260B3582|nr:DUF6252 family protein [uncultured Sunxiuqinia sp.]